MHNLSSVIEACPIEMEDIILSPSVQEYFAKPEAQQRLLDDKARLKAFEKAIHEVVRPGDIVMDIGAGTGILSQYAIDAGASKVYLVEENKHWLEVAERRLRSLSNNTKVEYIPKRSTNLSTYEVADKMDVIISETIGSFAINEGVLYTLTNARRFLASSGRLLPNNMKLQCAPFFLSNHKVRIKEPAVYRNIGNSIKLCKSKALLLDLDFNSSMPLRNTTSFDFRLLNSCQVNGMCFWFTSQLTDSISIDNSPSSKTTSWGQYLIPFASTCDEDINGTLVWNHLLPSEMSIVVNFNLSLNDHIMNFSQRLCQTKP